MAGALSLGCLLGNMFVPPTAESAQTIENHPKIFLEESEVPKYVFLFIGDGMSHAQTQLTNYYLDSIEYDNQSPQLEQGSQVIQSAKRISFMDFDAVGATTTYDSTSFVPDSASSATAIATGNKTHSGVIGMNETLTESFTPMSVQMKEQLGYKVGIITSVTLNHATPAAFYGANESRSNYYELGLDLVASDFDFFGGGEIGNHDNGGESTSIYQLAEEAGYSVVFKDQSRAESVSSSSEKVIIVGEDASDSLPYEMDRDEAMWDLSDYVKKGIEVLYNEHGFFMMVEGGKIDWACHAQDAVAAIHEVIAFDNSIRVALDFYKMHPTETLIVVTGDHETGGMTLGYAGTEYNTFFHQLSHQQNSYTVFNAMVNEYRVNGTSLEEILIDVNSFFGLGTTEMNAPILLSDYELSRIEAAYAVSMDSSASKMYEDEYLQSYGGYDPLTVTLLTILNQKSGLNFSTYAHSGATVGTYAHGVHSSYFDGFYDNTDIYHKTAQIMGLT